MKDLTRSATTSKVNNKKYMKIKFNWDDNLPVKQTLGLCNVMIVVRFIFDGNKYYPQVFLDERLYRL